MIIRKAHKTDSTEILDILHALDLHLPSTITDDFWVAEIEGKIVGTACITDYGENIYLSSVGVVPDHRGKGVAKAVLQNLFTAAKKDIYLYTLIPDFFKKFGFVTAQAPEDITSKDVLGCEDCIKENCVCMVRRRHSRHENT